MNNAANLDTELVYLACESTHDPLLFVEQAYPWGEGDLKGKAIRGWQRDYLIELGEKLKAGKTNAFKAIQESTASGHGIGKSALVAWLIDWAMCTHEDTKGVVTANTETQLKTKTWAELAKWRRMSAFNKWFTLTATALFSSDPAHEKTWRIDMIPWSERNTESFAGLHNEGKRIILIFDEASAIPDAIWEVSEGALTDPETEIIWAVFGNPTRANGRFRECFRRYRKRWHTRSIDSRTVKGASNPEKIKEWVEDHGEDSDFVKIRVRGVFPATSSSQFIPGDVIEQAMSGPATSLLDDPLVMSLDVARGGDDECVFRFRRGLDGRSMAPIKYPGADMRDSMKLVAVACELLDRHKPTAFFVDETGLGGPLVDRIRQLGHDNCYGIQFSAKSPDARYANMRAYMYFKLLEWFRAGGKVEDSDSLRMELEATDYEPHNARDQLKLIGKKEIKKLLGISPDDADALALLHAMPVSNNHHLAAMRQSAWRPAVSKMGY